MQITMDVYSILGWAGMVLIVLAYFLNSTGRLGSRSVAYQLMNLFGSAGVFVNVYRQEAWPAVALQVIWGAVALYALIRFVRAQPAQKDPQ